MASIRKRGGSYLIIVSMGYDHTGKRLKSQQKTVKPPEGLTKKQTEKWLNEQSTLFEMECKGTAPVVDRKTTLAQYTEYWLQEIAPDLHVFNTAAFIGKNASGKSTAVELLDCAYSILGDFRLEDKHYNYDGVDLEITFYHDGFIYLYKTV